MSMSCLLETDFQFENSYSQSKVIDLNRPLGNWDFHWFIAASMLLGFRSLVFVCIAKSYPIFWNVTVYYVVEIIYGIWGATGCIPFIILRVQSNAR